MTRIGDFTLTWGESLRWDDRRQRLWFVDCATQTLHWLEGGEPPLHTMQLDSLPTGVALTEGDELLVCLDDGLHVVNAEAGTSTLLDSYPEGMHGRANDADADGAGHLVCGTLNMGPAPGAYWWYSADQGWRLLDDDISNANGPVVLDVDGATTLVFGDTPAAKVYAYPYDGAAGTVGDRRVLSDHGALGGSPDGATGDGDGGVWSCVLGAGKLARLTGSGLDRTVDVPVTYPSDVCFGGPELDRLFVVSINLDLGSGDPGAQGGQLLALDGVGVGRPAPRFRL